MRGVGEEQVPRQAPRGFAGKGVPRGHPSGQEGGAADDEGVR